MQSKRRLILFVTAFTVVFGFLTMAAPLFAASKEKVLHSFNDNGKDGYVPGGGLIFDVAGNLYGTTAWGGAGRCTGGCGTVFQLAPGANGTWTETVLYSFCSAGGCTDGANPYADLIFDAAGNLYGSTYQGGSTACGGYGCGTVFELMPGTDGTWTETVLYSFCSAGGCTDGTNPRAGLIFDSAGNLYGSTIRGGAYGSGCGGYGCGTVFELMPGANGTWTETVLHSFGKGKDGSQPYAGLIFDTAGNLYGTTWGGGAGYGTVFELAPGAGGTWTETVLHSFGKGRDGARPLSGLIFDAAGNLYGTTDSGGAGHCTSGCGTVFQLAPGANGKWTEKVLHSFHGKKAKDGQYPSAGLIFDAAGNLYGTTTNGGAYGYGNGGCGFGGCGTVFELMPGTDGTWTETVLHSFSGKNGDEPYASLIFDAVGTLYGTTGGGGAYGNYGTVFEITP